MKIFLLVIVLGMNILFMSCDLAVPTEVDLTDVEKEDALLEDIQIQNDVISDGFYSDIQISDNEQTDIITTGCKTDRDCYKERPFCKDNICVECLTGEDCRENEICDETNQCQPTSRHCNRNSDCDMGFICKDSKCIEGCNTDKDCPPKTSPNSKICNVNSENPLCVECISDKDCIDSGLGTKCNESNACITISCDPPCNTWEHCTNEGKCELNEGACNSDKDCQVVDPLKVCDLKTHTCIDKPQCVADSDCDPLCPDCGGICKASKCECRTNCPKKQICEVCIDDSECEIGLVCKGVLGTKYCQPDRCATNSDCGGKYCIFGSCACGI